MPGVSKEQIAAAKKMTAIEFLRRYRSTDLVKSSARGEFELRSHDSFKINGESSIWHWKSRGIGGKSALDYLVHVEQCGFLEAVRMLCDEVPGYIPVAHEAVEQKRPEFSLPPAAPNNARVVAYLCGRGISPVVLSYTEVRARSDALCRRYGLSVIEDPQGERGKKQYAKWQAEETGKPTWRTLIRQDIEEAVSQCVTWSQFVRALERKGYEIRMGRKYPTLRPPSKERFVRFKTLGKQYTPEAIKQRILYSQKT